MVCGGTISFLLFWHQMWIDRKNITLGILVLTGASLIGIQSVFADGGLVFQPLDAGPILASPEEGFMAVGRLIALGVMTIFGLWAYFFYGRKTILPLMPLLVACLAFDISAFQELAWVKLPAFEHLSSLSLWFGALLLAAGSFLLRQTLNLRSIAPGLNQGMIGFEIFTAASILLLPQIPHKTAALMLLVIWLVVLLSGAALLIYYMQRGRRVAEIIMMGWMPVIGGALFGRGTGGGLEATALWISGLANTGFLLGLLYFMFMLTWPEWGAATTTSSQERPDEQPDERYDPALQSAGGHVKADFVEISPDRATGAAVEWDVLSQKLKFSSAAMALLHLEQAESNGLPETLVNNIHPIDREKLEQAIVAFLKRKNDTVSLDFRLKTHSENYRWIRLQASGFINPQGQMARCIATLVDVTMEKMAEARRMHNLVHDPITGLPNRALFLDRLARSVMEAKTKIEEGKPQPFAILLVDIDRFKAVNDTLGFAGGDRVLAIVGQRVLSVCRPHDTVSRIGDDEFTVLLPGIKTAEDASLLAERMTKALNKPIAVGDMEVFVQISIGVALLEDIDASPQDLLVDAEIALYRAKQGGRGKFEIYQPGMRHRPADMMVLDADLRRALERNEIELYYQPIECLKTGKLAGFEALLRWRHATRGLMEPDSFIWLAEETGTISALGHFAIKDAAAQLAKWQRTCVLDAPLFVSVNISSRQLVQRGLVDDIDRIMKQYPVAPRSLKLELTESQIMSDPTTAQTLLQTLSDRGLGLALDDFGTGYSSLSHLRQFPFDTLKIDRSFVSAMGEDEGTKTIVGSIIALAHDLDLTVVAEGVESEEDNDRLIAFGCDYGQGFRVGRPMPLVDAEMLVTKLAGEINASTKPADKQSGHSSL